MQLLADLPLSSMVLLHMLGSIPRLDFFILSISTDAEDLAGTAEKHLDAIAISVYERDSRYTLWVVTKVELRRKTLGKLVSGDGMVERE